MSTYTAETVVTDFVSIDPDAAIHQLVLDFKNEVKSLVGPQTYLEEPPHMTAYLARFSPATSLQPHFDALAHDLEPLPMAIEGFHTFDADPLTGNRTLVINFTSETQDRLRRAQAHIIKRIAPLRHREHTAQRYAELAFDFTTAQSGAVRDVGFPYIGDGWHPHFTIASIRPEHWQCVGDRLLARSPKSVMICPGISHYRVEEGASRLVKHYPFQKDPLRCL